MKKKLLVFGIFVTLIFITMIYINNKTQYNKIFEELQQKDEKKEIVDIDVTIVTEIQYDDAGNVIGGNENTYDEPNNLWEKIEYDAEGNVIGGEEYTYDKNGNLVKTVKYDGNGIPTFVEEKAYDEMNCFLSRVEYDGKGNMILYAKITSPYKENPSIPNEFVASGFIVDGNGKQKGKVESTYYDIESGEYFIVEVIEDNATYAKRRQVSFEPVDNRNEEWLLEVKDGKTVKNITYITTPEGTLVQELRLEDDETGINEFNEYSRFYSYDWEGKLYFVSEMYNGEFLSEATYHYDDQAKLMRIEDTVDDSVVLFLYNEQGELMNEIKYSQDKEVIWKKEYRTEKIVREY